MEREGAWPLSFNCALVALIGKAGATHEGQLRPICLLPYVYRAWMKMRKKYTKDWTTRLYGPQAPGALKAAWKLRALEEVWSHGWGLYGSGPVGREQVLRACHTLSCRQKGD